MDSLRALTIVGVVFSHSTILLTSDTVFGPIDVTRLLVALAAKFPAQMFLILSGFSLALSFERRRERGDTSILSLYVRRLFRLSPMYYAVLVWAAIAGYNEVLEQGTVTMPVDGRNLLLHVSYLHGLFPEYLRSIVGTFWTLTPIVLFSMALPFLMNALRTTMKRLFLFLFSLAVAITFKALWWVLLPASQTNETWVTLSPVTTFFLFCAGILIAEVYRWRHSERAERQRWIPWVANGLFVFSFLGKSLVYYIETKTFLGWLLMILLVLSYALGSSWFEGILSFSPLRTVGTVSYSIYLLHFPIMNGLIPIFSPHLGVVPDLLMLLSFFGTVLFCTMVLSTVTYRAIERPGAALGDRVVRYLATKRNAPAISPDPALTQLT